MNKRWIFLIVVVLALFAFSGALAKGTSGTGGADLPRLGVHYDGYSDGLGLSASGSYVNGEECGSTTNDVWGAKHYQWGVSQVMHDPDGSTADMQTVVTFDGRWAHFDPAGLVNQGTWTPGCPGHGHRLPKSTDAGAPAVDLAQAIMAVDISFDGFCDGVSLTVSGSSSDVAYAVDGAACGCETHSVFGSRYTYHTRARTAIQPDSGVAGDNLLLIVDDDTTNKAYRVFDENGLVLAGTWSWGCPAGAAATLPSMFDQAISNSKK